MPDTNPLTTEPKTGLLAAASKPGESVTGYTPSTATASTATAKGYDAKGVSVGDNDTVQGQVLKITGSDSPLMKQAERRAREEMAPRGLLNSSLAIGHAQEGVISQALPIAQQDANTYFTAKTKTADAENAALNFGANADNQASLANAQLGTETSRFNAGAKNDAGAAAARDANTGALAALDAKSRMDLAKVDTASRMEIAGLDSATRLQIQNMDNQTRQNMATLDNQYRSLLQTNTNAASMYSQAVAAIGNISASPNMPQDAKDNAIQTQLNMLQEALRVTEEISRNTPQTVASLDLSQFFNDGLATELTPEQITKRRAPIQAAVDNAYAAIPVWGENYAVYQAPPGPNQSERTAANFNALYSQRYQEYQQRLAELNAFNAQY